MGITFFFCLERTIELKNEEWYRNILLTKILHISTGDITGGAAIAAYRLHNALMTQGVDS